MNHGMTQTKVNCPVPNSPLTPSLCPVFHASCHNAAKHAGSSHWEKRGRGGVGSEDSPVLGLVHRTGQSSLLHSPKGRDYPQPGVPLTSMGSKQGRRHNNFHNQKGGSKLIPRRVTLLEWGMAQLGIRVYLNKERGCPDWQAGHLDPCQISAPV